LQISLKIDYKIFIIIGLSILWQPGLNVTAQALARGPEARVLSASFIRPEITQKTGQLSFNVVRIRNLSDTAVHFKPVLILPAGWVPFSAPFSDTIVPPNDSISLSFRLQLPAQASSDVKHEILFRTYSMQNKLLSESSYVIHPETFHDWDVIVSDKREFFYPRKNLAQLELLVQNKGNTAETVSLKIKPDNKIDMNGMEDWKSGQDILLAPFQDSLLKFNLKYNFSENRVFDISRIQINASVDGNEKRRAMMIEKYNDTYSPFYVDRALPHQTELGIRTFRGNDHILPFIKARGITTFSNSSTFQYNFNYYALTGNEDIISNSYYTFLYGWKQLRVGLGAFSSQLGRNLYTRTGLMVSNVVRLGPVLSLEAYVSQSFFTPKTSIAVGYTIEKKKLGLHGSVAYDLDGERKVNTGSVMLQSNLITLVKNHDIRFNLYGFHEYNYLAKEYTMMGLAWDFFYNGKIGNVIGFQFTNNYGTPNIPGPQMGLLNFGAKSMFFLGDIKRYFAIQYVNSSRKYHGYNAEGEKLPNTNLHDQYANIFFHSSVNQNHRWEAGPSFELYHSLKPPLTANGEILEYTATKLRFEYKAVIFKNLTLNMKTGVSDNLSKGPVEINEKKIDFHLLGGFNFYKGYGVSFSYDYGPMVNSGLYQSPGDANNNSINIGPGITTTYFKERVSFNLFAGLNYRFDLQYASVNINPKIEAFLFRDWYIVASGTYHYSRQQYPEFYMKNSYAYVELSVKKRWGKSDYNKWQKDTRRLKVVLFKDENGNGVKDENEKGVPFVKTRLILTNSDNPAISKQFPVDIILLSNAAGIVTYNRLPKGFYDLTLTPLGDVKEYFYVNRSAEKIQLTKNASVYIPFQKAAKISGTVNVQRAKFIKSGEEGIDLTNIKITAYNNQGNSYSSFTLSDGSFTIFLPGNDKYNIRMGNVFGPSFKILENDFRISVPDSTNNQLAFNVVETGRQVKFKEAKPALARADSLQKEALKIKVLHGKFYENSSEAAVDKNAIPVFDIKEAPVPEQQMLFGNYYVIIGVDSSRTEAVKLKKIVDENGFDTKLGYHEAYRKYYVYSNYYQNKADARTELERIRKAGYKDADIIKFE
jgi:hypothetical protein